MSDLPATLSLVLSDEVGIVDFINALNAAGLTFSNDPERGALVIHWMRAIRLAPEPPANVVAGPWPNLETKQP